MKQKSLPSRIRKAIEALRDGRMIILTDSEDRENEGDLILAADKVSPEAITFMARKACGLICLSMPAEKIESLQIPMMTPKNRSPRQTAFTVSIEAADGVDTGISALDRAKTIAAAAHPGARPEHLVSPGHVFPLKARNGNTLVRAGHTEGSLDLMKLAGLEPAAVICEVMNDDGTMARIPELKEFSSRHDLPMLTIEELIRYRVESEAFLEAGTPTTLPTPYGEFQMRSYRNEYTDEEHLLIQMGSPGEETPLVRVHSECLTGDAFGSLRCDCGPQLRESLRRISAEGAGVVVYLKGHEGRGIGLGEKLEAYALQDQGLDTVDANLQLGHPVDDRSYVDAAGILHANGLSRVRLMTNNPKKVSELESLGIEVERTDIRVHVQRHNEKYVETKENRMGHHPREDETEDAESLGLSSVPSLKATSRKSKG